MIHPLHQFLFCPVCGQKTFRDHNEKAKKCASCGFVYYFNPSAAVACFVRDIQGNILTVRRAKDPAKNTLDLPGGFVDMRESAEEAVMREVKEETNLTLHSCRYLFSLPNIYQYASFDVHTVDLFFEGFADDFTQALAADDAAGIEVFTKDTLQASDFGLDSIRKGIDLYKCKY